MKSTSPMNPQAGMGGKLGCTIQAENCTFLVESVAQVSGASACKNAWQAALRYYKGLDHQLGQMHGKLP